MKSTTTPNKPIIQIGPVCDDPTESVSSVNKALMDGLKENFTFVAPSSNRRHGTTKQARLNAWNLLYMVKHTLAWLWSLIRHRPEIAHYGITTAWALEKGLFLLLLARAFGAKVIGHVHAGDFGAYIDGLSGRRRSWALKQLQSLDAIIVLSEYWRDVVAKCANIPRERLFVVSNPINSEFERTALKFPINRQGNTILSLGTMSRDKGILDILDAIKLVCKQDRDFQLIIAGPEREPGILDEVKRRIASGFLEGNISLHQGVWGQKKIEIFRTASIMLLPSYIENFPLVVLEAAAAGQAIITTPVGAVPEFFKDKQSAHFVEPGNPEQIADTILRLLRDSNVRTNSGAAAREVFETRLGRSEIMSKVQSTYSHLLQQGPLIADPSEHANLSTRTTNDQDLDGQNSNSTVCSSSLIHQSP